MNHFKFSERTDWQLDLNEWSASAEQIKQSGISVIDLTVSNPTACSFKYNAEITGALSNSRNAYYSADAFGLLPARKEVAAYYHRRGYDVDPSRIILTSSTSEAYTYLFRLLLNPKDRVHVPKPSYPLFDFLAQLNDVEQVAYLYEFKNRWLLNIDSLKSELNHLSKVILTVHPNNPTGHYVSIEDQAVLEDICLNSNCALISDEVFWDYDIDSAKQSSSFLGLKNTPSFILGGLSKALGLPQMKLSWIVVNGPDEFCTQALARLEIIADTYLSVSAPAQHALSDWMLKDKEIQREIRERIRSNYKFVCSAFENTLFSVLPSEGGWSVIVSCSEIMDLEQWVLDVLQTAHVKIHPGYFFDSEDEQSFVVSLLIPCDQLAEGINRIKELCNDA